VVGICGRVVIHKIDACWILGARDGDLLGSLMTETTKASTLVWGGSFENVCKKKKKKCKG
jgi:hypothetical protein